jgi:chemosensory pili system protein ChpA (sensor histidine kinase/response regulator)
VELPAILNALLNFPMDVASTTSVRPVLVLQSAVKVQVDEVLGEGEFVVKPLSSHLQRPGVAGTAIDGMGNVLLILDVPELVRRQHQPALRTKAVADQSDQRKTSHEAAQPIVLVADDSVYIRQSLLRMLGRAGYKVMAVQDGMEALGHLLDYPPDVLVLDVEMPNLNGFDVLNIMRTHGELAHVKVLMLTTRSSEKHSRRAYELGADRYLIKPCPQDMLLETLRVLLEDKG